MPGPIHYAHAFFLNGLNVWADVPVFEVWVDIQEVESASYESTQALSRCIFRYLPALSNEAIASPHGAQLPRILEYVAFELQRLAGIKLRFHQSYKTSQPGRYQVIVETLHEQLGFLVFKTAQDLIGACLTDQQYDLASALDEIRSLIDSVCLGPSTAHIVEAARGFGIPSIRLSHYNLMQLGYGKYQRRIWTAVSDQTNALAIDITSDKNLTKKMLDLASIPVPRGCVVDKIELVWEQAQHLGLPVVVKPLNSNHGTAVALNLQHRHVVEAAFKDAIHQSPEGVIVEQYILGDEHRILVINDQVVAGISGEFIVVVGDGLHNITELVDLQVNSDTRRGEWETNPLNKIELEDTQNIILELKQQGYHPASIPEAGVEVVILRHGDLKKDSTDLIHPSIALMVRRAAKVLNLDIAGIDLIAQDISKPLHEQSIAIIEVNASPGLLYHIYPGQGQSRPVCEAMIHYLFPKISQSRIPIVGICGSQDRSFLAASLRDLWAETGNVLGLASEAGLFIANRRLSKKNALHRRYAEQLLINKNLEGAVMAHDPLFILREGFAYDKCSVALITDVTYEPAYAEFFITDLQGLFKVYRAQLNALMPEGIAVLNADDPNVLLMAQDYHGQRILYSMNPHNAAIIKARRTGQKTVFFDGRQRIIISSLEDDLVLNSSLLAPKYAQRIDCLLALIAVVCALNLDVQNFKAFHLHHNEAVVALL